MSISPLNNLALSGLQSIFGALQGAAGTSQTGNTNTTGSTSGVQQSDSSQLSPFAQLLTTLQQLEQSNPTQYQQVTQQIATNLQNASKTAQADGNSTLANQLNQLSTDFSNASQNGQLPNIQDLAQAAQSHHHGGHHHGHGGSSNQFLSDLQSSQNPMTIITNTLTAAGISTS